MKLLKNATLLFIASAFILTASCKKYPDGPLLSLHTKAHRVDGRWNLDYLSINGYDSTSEFKNHRYYGFYQFIKEKEGRTEFNYYSYGSYGIDTNYWYAIGGEWAFDDHKNNIRISGIFNGGQPWRHFNLGIFNESQATLWQIQRLTEKDMWLKGTYPDGREYFVKLEQKNA
jgi:hypothetical protein